MVGSSGSENLDVLFSRSHPLKSLQYYPNRPKKVFLNFFSIIYPLKSVKNRQNGQISFFDRFLSNSPLKNTCFEYFCGNTDFFKILFGFLRI